MKTYPLITELIETTQRNQIIDLTDLVRRHVKRSGLTDGLLTVFSQHTTAAVSVNENFDPSVKQDLLRKLESMVPLVETYYEHDEGNSDAHVKAALLGSSVMLIVDRGELVLGRWQGVYFCEFDGPRERRINIKLIAG